MLPKLLHNKRCHAMDTLHCPDSGLMPSDFPRVQVSNTVVIKPMHFTFI